MTQIQADLRRADWRTSSHSSQNGACVEVARNLPSLVAVRDSKDRLGPALAVTHGAWRSLLDGIRSGRLTL